MIIIVIVLVKVTVLFEEILLFKILLEIVKRYQKCF
jgi:hypothetical protein